RGLSGVTVQLTDDSGNVLATTVTDRQGHYRFDNFNGIGGTGNYNVRVVVPSGFTQKSANPSTILISSGDVNVSGVNFILAPTRRDTSPGGNSTMANGEVCGWDPTLDLGVINAGIWRMSRRHDQRDS